MHVGQHHAYLRAMNSLWLELTFAIQTIDHGRWLIGHRVQDVAIGVGSRVGNRNAFVCQMFHQKQIEGQLFVIEALKQSEHVSTLVGGGEVVGVFNAAFNALQFGQLTQIEFGQEGGCKLLRNGRKNSHGLEGA